MTDVQTIPFDDEAQDRAIQLLGAADDLGYERSVVQTITGAFRAPEDVVKKAGLTKAVDNDFGNPVPSARSLEAVEAEQEESPAKEESKPAAKKAPAKKAAKKAPAKKAAKKAPAKKASRKK